LDAGGGEPKKKNGGLDSASKGRGPPAANTIAPERRIRGVEHMIHTSRVSRTGLA
jgi:hypothetical protein